MSAFKEIRRAILSDCEEMLRIYTPFVTESAVSFEMSSPTLAEFRERFSLIATKYPWFVYTENGKVLGYAYASSHRERKAYQWCVETTVYLAPEAQSKGIAAILYENLMHDLKILGYFTAYAVIALPNEASSRFHERFGFKDLTIFPKAGYKMGTWHDVLWMRYEISDPPIQPLQPRSVSELMDADRLT